MFCRKCGAEIMEGGVFCCECGTPVEGAQTKAPVTQAPPKVPKKPRRSGSKLPVIIACAAGGIVVLALLMVLLVGVVGGDSVKVANAVSKSVGAYTDAVDKLSLPEVSGLIESGAYSQEVSVWADEIPYYDELEGIGVRVNVDSNIPKQKLAIQMTPYFGSLDLITVQAKADGAKIYAGSPEMTGDKYFMVNTKTLGQTLYEQDLIDEELSGLGFNIFEVAEQVQALNKESEKLVKEVKAATTQLLKDIEVKKTGSKTIDVNDNEVKCTEYHVVLTSDAMAAYLETVMKASMEANNMDAYLDILASIGMPDYLIDEIAYGISYEVGSMEEVYESLEYIEDMLGDIELDLYVSKGYVMSVVYEGEIDGMETVISLDLGGGKNYVDDLSFVVEVEDEMMLAVVSTGDHGAKGGTFTDETVVTMEEYGYKYDLLKSRISYEPGAKKDENFQWKLQMEDVTIKMQGMLSGGKNKMDVRMDKFSLKIDDEELSVGLEYHLSDYKSDDIKVKNSIEILTMSEDDLLEVGEEVSENMMNWAGEIYERYPDLIDNLSYLFW